jgi:hypothetical protein
VELIDGNTVSATWHIGAFMRLPERGDFAYADGTFDDEVVGGKTIVGMALTTSSIDDAELNVIGKSVEVCSMKYPRITSTDGTIDTISTYWGVYQGTGTSQIPQAFVQEVAAASGNVDLVTTPTPYSASDLNSKLNHNNIMALANAVINGYLETMWRNTDLSNYQGSVTQSEYSAMLRTKMLANAGKLPTTPSELGDMMEAFAVKMRVDGNSEPNRFQQFFFPRIYACSVYEPIVNEGETLHQAYRSGSWYMMAMGHLKLTSRFNHASRNKVNGAIISSQYANEDNTVADEDYPLFANMLKRLEDAGVSTTIFEQFDNSYHFSTNKGFYNYSIYILSFGNLQEEVRSIYKNNTDASYKHRAMTTITYLINE